MKLSFDFAWSDFKLFFQPENLFNANSSSALHFLGLLLILFIAIIFLGILIKIYYWRKFPKHLIYKQFSDKILNCHLICGFSGIVLTFCNYEKITFLSMPLLILLLIIIYILWVIYLIYYRFWIMNSKMIDYQMELRKQQYLTKRKKH